MTTTSGMMPTFTKLIYALFTILVLSFCVDGFKFSPRYIAKPSVQFQKSTSIIGSPASPYHEERRVIAGPSSKTALALDFFGLGLPEIVVLTVLLYLLYATSRKKPGEEEQGPGRALKQDWQKARFNRIKELRFDAQEAKRRRALKRMYTAMENGDEYVLERFDQYESSGEVD